MWNNRYWYINEKVTLNEKVTFAKTMWSRTLCDFTLLYDIKIPKRESSHNVVIRANHANRKTMALLRQNRSKNISSFKFLFHYTVNLQIMWESSASFTYISSKVIKDTNVSQLARFQRMAHLDSEWSALCNGHQGELSRILHNSSLHWGVIFQSIYCFCIQSIFPTCLH